MASPADQTARSRVGRGAEALTAFPDKQRDILMRCALKGRHDRKLRWLRLHHSEGVARHAGYGDIIREAIGGSTGEC